MAKQEQKSEISTVQPEHVTELPEPTVQDTLMFVGDSKARIAEQKKKSAHEIKIAVRRLAFQLTGSLPNRLLVAINVTSTPEDDYLSIVKYVPATNVISGKSYTIQGSKLVEPPLFYEMPESKWLEYGEEVIIILDRASKSKNSGQELTLEEQISWYMKPGLARLEIPKDLLEPKPQKVA